MVYFGPKYVCLNYLHWATVSEALGDSRVSQSFMLLEPGKLCGTAILVHDNIVSVALENFGSCCTCDYLVLSTTPAILFGSTTSVRAVRCVAANNNSRTPSFSHRCLWYAGWAEHQRVRKLRRARPEELDPKSSTRRARPDSVVTSAAR